MKYKLGSYTFYSNPEEKRSTQKFIGDILQTQNGRKIVMPSSFSSEIELKTTFHQPRTHKKSSKTLSKDVRNFNCISFYEDEYYIGNSEGQVAKVNHNFMNYSEKFTIDNSEKDIQYIYFDGTDYYLVVFGDNYYKILQTDTSGSIQESLEVDNQDIVGIASYNDTILILEQNGTIKEVNSDFTELKEVSTILTDYTYDFIMFEFNNNFYWAIDKEKIFQIDLNKDKIIGIDNYKLQCNDITFNKSNDLIELYNNKVEIIKPNTVLLELEKINDLILNNSLSLIDEQNKYYEVNITNHSIKRLDDLDHAYQVTIKLGVVQ